MQCLIEYAEAKKLYVCEKYEKYWAKLRCGVAFHKKGFVAFFSHEHKHLWRSGLLCIFSYCGLCATCLTG